MSCREANGSKGFGVSVGAVPRAVRRGLLAAILGFALQAQPAGATDWKPGTIVRGEDGRLILAPPDNPSSDAPRTHPARVCAPESAETGCDFNSLADALAAAEDGKTIVIGPGVYREAAVIRANNLTLRAEPGAHLTGVAAEGKAALVIKGDNTVIEGLECSNVAVPDRNGACIRLEGRHLTLRRVNFHHNQQGILSGPRPGLVKIEDSVFRENGISGGGYAHNIYIGGGVLVLLRTSSLAARDEGHEVKSRAITTIIEDSVIASLDSRDSRLIDVPNGGHVVIRDSVLQMGRATSNAEAIGIGLERGRGHGRDHTENSAKIEGNTILLERPGRSILVRTRGVPPAVVRNNVVVGGRRLTGDGNRWFPDRRSAGLPPYPSLDFEPGVGPAPNGR